MPSAHQQTTTVDDVDGATEVNVTLGGGCGGDRRHRYSMSKTLKASVLHHAKTKGGEAGWNSPSVRGIVEDNNGLVESLGLPVVPATPFAVQDVGPTPPVTSTFAATEFATANVDTVSAALALTKLAATDPTGRRQVGILSFANAQVPGGLYVCGARAQEEDLCRLLPQLYPTLVAAKAYPIPPHTTLVSRDVLAVRRPGTYEPFPEALLRRQQSVEAPSGGSDAEGGDDDGATADATDVTKLTVLTAAMPCGACDRRPAGGWLKSAWAEDVSLRIRSVLQAAVASGCVDVVLGAFGCGAFGNPPGPVAALFAAELKRPAMRGAFRRVVFAVLDPIGTGNYRPFSEGIAVLHDDTK